MNRVLPSLLAGVTVGVMGVRHGAHLKAEAARITRWEALLRHLALLLREGAYTLPETLEHAAREHGSPDETLRRLAQSLREQPLIPLETHYAALAADTLERDVLTRWSARLSHGTKEERGMACEQAAAELALLSKAAREKADQDAKMWSSLGWTVGACLALMLL